VSSLTPTRVAQNPSPRTDGFWSFVRTIDIGREFAAALRAGLLVEDLDDLGRVERAAILRSTPERL
jgi:hypothetical protein